MIINIMRGKGFQKHSFLNCPNTGLSPAPVLKVPLKRLWLMAAAGLPRVTSQGTEGVVPSLPHLSAAPPPALKGCYSRKAQLDKRTYRTVLPLRDLQSVLVQKLGGRVTRKAHTRHW